MPDASKRELILKAILAVIRGMTSAVTYARPLVDAGQATSDPTVNVLTWPSGNLPVWVVEPVPDDAARAFFPGMHLTENMVVNVVVRDDAAAPTGDYKMERWEALAADLERAFTVDTTLGGLVYDVRVLAPRPFAGVGQAAVVVVQPIAVRLHRTYGQP